MRVGVKPGQYGWTYRELQESWAAAEQAGLAHLARIDHQTLGIPFPPHGERVRRLEACCRVLPTLWRGAAVDEPALGLRQASLGPIEIKPPELFVGGASDAALEIAAHHPAGGRTA